MIAPVPLKPKEAAMVDIKVGVNRHRSIIISSTSNLILVFYMLYFFQQKVLLYSSKVNSRTYSDLAIIA